MKKLYIISPKIKYETFKLLQEKLVKDSGPTPKEMDKILWEMNRDGNIILWFAGDMPNDMGVGFKLPKKYREWEKVMIKSSL